MEKRDIRQELYWLRKQGREEYLKLMGINVEEIRKIETKIDAKYGELAGQIRDSLKDMGKKTVEMHDASLKRTESIILKDTELMIAGLARPALGDRVKIPICWCSYPNTASSVPPPTDETILEPPTGGGASGSVTYNAAANVAHPKADVSGMGTGTINSAKVTTSFRFPFNPTSDRTYCIRPLVYMNGHWLVWTWGTCAGTAEDLGTGEVKVTLRVRVTQLDEKLAEIEHVVLHKNASNGQDFHSGFAYDSEVDGGASMTVYLKGGYTAVVWVECESYAEIANHGKAWVDIQTSPSFYFKVDQVKWGPRTCWPWVFGHLKEIP